MGVAELLGEGGKVGGLVRGAFEKESGADGGGLGQEATKQIKPIGATVEGEHRIVANFGFGRGDFLRSEIGKIGRQKNGRFRLAMEKVALFPLHFCSFGRGGGGVGAIFLGEKKCLGGNIEAEIAVLGLATR